MTEDEILNTKPFTTEETPHVKPLESLAGELVDTMMNRLQTFSRFRDATEVMDETEKRRVDNELMRDVVCALRMSPLVHTPKSGEPLIEPEGKVFQVQVGGGLLLSEQKA